MIKYGVDAHAAAPSWEPTPAAHSRRGDEGWSQSPCHHLTAYSAHTLRDKNKTQIILHETIETEQKRSDLKYSGIKWIERVWCQRKIIKQPFLPKTQKLICWRNRLSAVMVLMRMLTSEGGEQRVSGRHAGDDGAEQRGSLDAFSRREPSSGGGKTHSFLPHGSD